MAIHAERDRRIAVAELRGRVGDPHAVLEQQRRKRVAHLMRASPIQSGRIEDAIQRLPHVRLVECGDSSQLRRIGSRRGKRQQRLLKFNP
jgi:hypothetical protein